MKECTREGRVVLTLHVLLLCTSRPMCDHRYGALPLVANLLGVFRQMNSSRDVDYPDTTSINMYALIGKGTALMFGGPSLWGTVIKIKSRVLSLINGPRRILSGECPFRKLYMYK